MVKLERELCADLQQALQYEWLETDGLGGFACATVLGAHTRRYHGLLVAATHPPVGRRVLLSKLEETLQYGEQSVALGTNLYPNAVFPKGYRYAQGFRLDPWPVMTFRAEEMELEKSVFMPHGLPATVIQYHLSSAPAPLWLLLRPLLACRDYHHLSQSSTAFDSALTEGQERFTVTPYDPASQVTLHYPGGEFWRDGLWYYNFLYLREQERGLDFQEDLYSPGEIRFLLNPGETVSVVACSDPDLRPEPEAWAQEERTRRAGLTEGRQDPVSRQLLLAADQFLVRRQVRGKRLLSIIAGYPWFTDWGRDAMIALPGLLLAPGRVEEAGQVLQAFAGHLRHGLLPNTFGDDGRGAAYNTVDASLWFIQVVRHYAERVRQPQTLRPLQHAVEQILTAYREGTDYGIGMDKDGLLHAGSSETQLTWMDAKVGEAVFTPRDGKPVEINGLWYSALRTADYLEERVGRTSGPSEGQAGRLTHRGLAARVRAAFESAFWCEERGYFYDCLGPGGPDASLRPNQVLALSLPYALGTAEQMRRALQAVTAHLLTPFGLRTLAPDEPGYRGQYTGDQWSRDSAYHNGTVWPWLLGPYCKVYLRVEEVTADSRRQVRAFLQPLVDYLLDGGVGTLPEIFDGDPPHAPRGSFAQAWSVAEVLRLWLQYRLDEA